MLYNKNMAGKNILKADISDSFYHAYSRGVDKQVIYHDHQDYSFFLWLLKRHLTEEEIIGARDVPYEKLNNHIELLAFCLMPNHFHLLFFQIDAGTMTRLMRTILTGYSRYYNHKYHRSGPLFESRFKASRISSNQYLLHISRYIHMNPKDWQTYKYSSLGSYLGNNHPDWIKIKRISALFSSKTEYLRFLEDYMSQKEDLKLLKHELADG